MREGKGVPGAEEFWGRLPAGWRWFYFDTILDFQIRRVSEFWEPPRCDGSLLICDASGTWRVRLTMGNVTGELSFLIGQELSGLNIEDVSASRGYEKCVRWRIGDFEDHGISIFCEALRADLEPPPEAFQ